MPHFDTLLIDFDGTICFDHFWRSAEQNVKLFIKSFLFGEDSTLVNNWMIGKLTTENVVALIAEKGGFNYQELWDIFKDDCQSMHISIQTLKLINSSKAKFNTVLITDNMDSLDRFTIPALSLDHYFNIIVNSYNYKALKGQNGGDLFLKASQKNNLNIENSILIDNSENNCQIFEALGGKSYLVKKPSDIDHILKTLNP